MKNLSILIAVLLVVIVMGFSYLEKSQTKSTIIATMKISSSAFANNQTMPITYTCDGKNINPPLEFSDIPKQTKSVTLIMDDPDAPMGTWVHWTIINMSPSVRN